MKRTIIILTFLSGLLAVITACKKEAAVSKNYYGHIRVSAAAFPNTPRFEVRFSDKILGDVSAENTFMVDAEIEHRLSIYIKETGTLIADTLVRLKPNETRSFKVAYSQELKLKGWLNTVPVSPDSMAFQLLNNLGPDFRSYPSLDLHIFYYDAITGEIGETGKVLANFPQTDLSAPFLVPYAGTEDAPYFYFAKLKDNSTGNFLIFPSGSDLILLPVSFGGSTSIYNVHDVAGEVTADQIEL